MGNTVARMARRASRSTQQALNRKISYLVLNTVTRAKAVKKPCWKKGGEISTRLMLKKEVKQTAELDGVLLLILVHGMLTRSCWGWDL